MVQHKTENLSYWQNEFSVTEKDIEFIFNHILEGNQLLTLDEIVVSLISHLCDKERDLKKKNKAEQGKIYQPKENYTVGEQLLFLSMDSASGTVQHIRKGQHPDYVGFLAITVAFEDGTTREFAAGFNHPHTLNIDKKTIVAIQEGMLSPEDIYQQCRESIRPKVKDALLRNDDFVKFHEKYFLSDLLSDFHEGLFNIADAAIDLNNGPLDIDNLIEQMGMHNEQEITDIVRFTVSHNLNTDDRFADVGPKGHISWYLKRLEPPEAYQTPRRLQINDSAYDKSSFNDDTYSLLSEIDDEATNAEDIKEIKAETARTTITLTYPHRQAGTLPLTPKTIALFPTSSYNPVLFEFVDGRTGDIFPGWVSLKSKYVFGLTDWYSKNKLPVGAYINIKRTNDPMRVVVEYRATRPQRDWVRVATVVNNRLIFQMNKEAINCKYDELLIIGESNQAHLDSLWLNMEEKGVTVYSLLCQIFPELSKLNPQSTVHAKTVYSAVNIVRRTSPGLIFQELTTHSCFTPINHGYWTYDPDKVD